MDPQTREHIWEYIERLVAEQKLSIVLTTHYMDEADRLCNRIAIVDHGKIVVLDTPENLKHALGGDVIRLRMSTPNLKAIESLPYVRKIDVQDSTVSLTVADSGSHIQEILGVIGKVDSVECHPPSLNDVFMHYTGRELREQESGRGGWQR